MSLDLLWFSMHAEVFKSEANESGELSGPGSGELRWQTGGNTVGTVPITCSTLIR